MKEFRKVFLKVYGNLLVKICQKCIWKFTQKFFEATLFSHQINQLSTAVEQWNTQENRWQNTVVRGLMNNYGIRIRLVFPNNSCVTVTNTKAKNKYFSSVAHTNKTGGEIKLKS